ncbi:PapD-like protein [Crepidotus variabilis]|uniref:PapD-like protein n=1 Tax=Crepidotus variabilis TaxID=179855 RepID=A0A9P6EAX2_9AGAR|nr:PapD-like protein [Crepidotus variabilis]
MIVYEEPLVDKPSLTMKIQNKSSRHVVFRIKTTAPKLYTTKPHQGMILPGESMAILVTVVGWKQEPQLAGLRIKDKFLIQTADVPQGQEQDTVQDVMTKVVQESEQLVKQRKLKVAYLPPEPRAHTPYESEVEDVHHLDRADVAVGGSGVLVDHYVMQPSPPQPINQESSASSQSSPDESLGGPPPEDPLQRSDYHEAAKPDFIQSLPNTQNPLVDTSMDDSMLDQSELRQRRPTENYDHASQSAPSEYSNTPSQISREISISERIPPFLQQGVPLWTVLASVAATYTATRFLGL